MGNFTLGTSLGICFAGSATFITGYATLFTNKASRRTSNFTLGTSRDARATSNELLCFLSLFCLKNRVYAIVKALFC